MDNARKRKIFISKRHVRRIITDKTNIDIAGTSKYIPRQLYRDVHVQDAYSLDLYKSSHETIKECDANDIHEHIKFSNKENNSEQHANNTIQMDSDNNSYNSLTIYNNDNINNDVNDDANNYEQFKNAIATWAISYNISHKASNELLNILNQHTSYNFSIDIRTLLQTPRETNIVTVCGGEFFYLGLYNVIKQMLQKSISKCINLLLNIDVLPLHRSSNASLWPILCSNTIQKDVYLIGAYFGYSKPYDANVYLQPLVN